MFHQNSMTMSRAIHIQKPIPKHYQIMVSSMARLNLLKTRSVLGIIPKASQTSFIKVGSQNQKLFMFKFQYQNGKNRSSGKKFSGLQNWVVRGFQIGAGLRDCK